MPTEQDNTSFLLGGIAADIKNLMASFRQHRDDVDNKITSVQNRLNGHNDRIARVEQGYWRVVGIASAVPILVASISVAVAYFT